MPAALCAFDRVSRDIARKEDLLARPAIWANAVVTNP